MKTVFFCSKSRHFIEVGMKQVKVCKKSPIDIHKYLCMYKFPMGKSVNIFIYAAELSYQIIILIYLYTYCPLLQSPILSI